MDVRQLADEIASATPEGAARSLARILKAVRDLFSARQLPKFEAAYAAELAKLGYRFERDPALVAFNTLRVGDEFVDARGRRCRRIEPVIVRDYRDDFTMRLEALNLATDKPLFIQPSQIVRKV